MPNTFQAVESANPKDMRMVGGYSDAKWLKEAARVAALHRRAAAGDRLAQHQFIKEAATISDYPLLLGDTLGRELRAKYDALTGVWQSVALRRSVNDYRSVKSFAPFSVNGPLSAAGELFEDIPARNISDRSPVEYALANYGAGIKIGGPTLINDDVGQFTQLPDDLATAARATEDRLFTAEILGSAGPATGITAITGNPPLEIAGLRTAIGIMLKKTDPASGVPIMTQAPVLMVPPSLAIRAQELQAATLVQVMNTSGSTPGSNYTTPPWMRDALMTIVVNPWIELIAGTNRATTWFLFGRPAVGRSAVEMAFLRGFEQPRIFAKAQDMRPVGGGSLNELEGTFNSMSFSWQVRHTLAAKFVDTQGVYSYGSNGSGS
jgi:hypothetical protein